MRVRRESAAQSHSCHWYMFAVMSWPRHWLNFLRHLSVIGQRTMMMTVMI